MSRRAWIACLILVGCTKSGPEPDPCPPGDCSAEGFDCGTVVGPDGCRSCGSCAFPETCGGAGAPQRCGCQIPDCRALGAECGALIDRCTGGPPVSCGECEAPDTCGGADAPNRCGRRVEVGETCDARRVCPVNSLCCSDPNTGANATCALPVNGGCPPLLPNLVLDREQLIATLEVASTITEPSETCQRVGCSMGGERMLARYALRLTNPGPGILELGSPSLNNPNFTFESCDSRLRPNLNLVQELLDAEGNVLAGNTHRLACIDDDTAPPGSGPTTVGRFRCFAPDAGGASQGLSVGWAFEGIPFDCQWVDVSEIEPGDYFLQVSVNADRAIAETNYEDNTVKIPLRLQ